MRNELGQVIQNEPEKLGIKWTHMYVPVNKIILSENIRPIDQEVVSELSSSILANGQLQASLGDTIEINGEPETRLLAGFHRYYAVENLNKEGFGVDLLIRVADRTLSEEEILSIQMSENLHNKMTPDQEAKIIFEYWDRMVRLYGRENITISFLAAQMGRSPRKVSESIKFVEGLSPKVQELVSSGILSYSTALLLVGLGNDPENFYDEQLRTAVQIVAKNLTTEKAKKYINTLKQEKSFAGSLFGNDVWEEIKKNGHKLSIQSEADRSGREATGWFAKMIKVILHLENPEKVELSNGIVNALEEVGMSLNDFYTQLDRYSPKTAGKIREKLQESLM